MAVNDPPCQRVYPTRGELDTSSSSSTTSVAVAAAGATVAAHVVWFGGRRVNRDGGGGDDDGGVRFRRHRRRRHRRRLYGSREPQRRDLNITPPTLIIRRRLHSSVCRSVGRSRASRHQCLTV